MTFEAIVQIIGTGALILGSTWKLSAQISSIATKLDAHMANDAQKFEDIDGTLNVIAPRVVRLERRQR